MKRFLALFCILACLCALCLPAAAAIDYTIRVKAPSSMKEVYLYMWNSMDESQKNAEWPGVKLTKKVDGWYEVKMSNDFYDRVIISNGVGGPGTQTKDIEVDALYDLWITVDASYNYGVAYSEKEAGKVEFAGPDYMSIVGMNIPGVADWSTNDPNGVMEEVKNLVYEKTIGLAKGTTMTFKFTGNGTWDLPYNMGGNVAGEQIPLNKSRDLVENGQDMTFTATKDMGLKITLNLTGMANGGKATFKLEEVDGVDIPEPPAPVEKDYFVAGEAGLCGKSVIPFIVGTGCAIPGVMAARTIRNERERNATAMLAPFMPCGAKLPVIALFAGAFFGDASWVGTLMYFVGIILILLCALLVNKIAGHKKRKSFFIIELPEYKSPSLKRACMDMLSRGWAYIVKAGTIILLCNAVVYIMQSFNWNFQLVEEGMEHTSILASIANPIAVVLVPIVGITAWQLAAAAVTGFIAKENVVGTLAVCYGISNLIDTEELSLVEGAGTEVAAIIGITKVAALAYLMFNLFTPPCFAAMGAMNAEIKDKKWLWGGIALQLGVGYTIGYLVYTIGTLIVDSTMLSIGATIGGGIFVAIFAAILVCLCVCSDKKVKAEYALSGK